MDRTEAIELLNKALGCLKTDPKDCPTNCSKCENHATTEDGIEALGMAIEALEGKDNDDPTKWIPVSKRLPEISEKDVYGNVTFSKPVWGCMKYGDGFTWQGIDQYTTNNGGGWLSEVSFDDPEECSKVVAWMPLPEPYEEE